MGDFLQLRMEDPAAKGLVASFLLVFVGLGGYIWAQFKGPAPAGPKSEWVLCESCGASEELSPDNRVEQARALLAEIKVSNPDFYEQLLNPAMGGMMMPGGMTEDMVVQTWGRREMGRPFTCSSCGERTAFLAVKCEQCGNVFIGSREGGDFFDRCPKCSFSKQEQSANERRAAEREKKNKPRSGSRNTRTD